MEEGLALLAWLSFELVLLFTGKGVITALSLGRWRGEQISKKEGHTYSAAGSLSFVRDGQRVVTATGLLFAGLGFYAALVVLFVCLS